MDWKFNDADEYVLEDGTFRVSEPYALSPDKKSFKISVFSYFPGNPPDEVFGITCEKACEYCNLTGECSIEISKASSRVSVDFDVDLIYETVYAILVCK